MNRKVLGGLLGLLVSTTALADGLVFPSASGVSPTFSGTVTMPDGSTWTSSGLTMAQPIVVPQGDLQLLGTSMGKTTLNSGLSGAGNSTLTLPATVADTLGGLGTAETWTAAQTFANSDLILKGSSTGTTIFSSANAGASTFTLTIPAATDTLMTLGQTQTVSGGITFSSAADSFTSGLTISGGAANINNTGTNNSSIAGGANSGTITIGNSSHTGNTTLGGVSTGTNTVFLCASSTGVVLNQTSACTISSKRYKNLFGAFKGDALYALMHLEVWDYAVKLKSNDPNGHERTVGLTAEGVAQWASACSVWESKDGKFIRDKAGRRIAKSYKQECLIGMLAKGMQQQEREIADLRAELHSFVPSARGGIMPVAGHK